MTLRSRLAVLTSAAVAVAVLAASVAAWFLIRATLMDDVDQRLLDRAPDADRIAAMAARLDAVQDGEQVVMLAQGDPIGIQRVESDGTIATAIPPGDVQLTLTPEERRLLGKTPGEPLLRTVTIDGAAYRVMSVAVHDLIFLRMVSPLERVESAMTRMAWLLAAVAGVGVAGAGAIGWVIVRAGLRPVDRLAAAAEQVAVTKDLAHRITIDGNVRDEIARLAGSVNTMLAALDEARTEQRHLVEDAGHELRTPLATLRNDIGVLVRAEQRADRELAADDRAALLRDLESEVESLSELVAELVDLARGDVEPEQPLESDLRALVKRAVASNRRVDPGVDVTVRGDSFEATVRPIMLERAIGNLVRNAVQVSPDGSRVDVELAEDGGWATVRVLDRGPGITAEDEPRIFDRFYRGAGARERQGSGLGLAIVAQVADQHGGTVSVGNRPGGGAIFALRFPIDDSDAPTQPSSPRDT